MAARREPGTRPPDGPYARWKHALKPASWPKLLVPFALGQALGVAVTGGLSVAALLVALAFTVADLVFIVLMNDWGDREVDALKRSLFPDGCSPKTIPDGILPAHHVLFVGGASGVVALLVSAGGGLVLDRPLLGPAGLACLLIFVAYTLPPLRLNYRGGGELLETLGVGFALPWFSAYAQSGELLAPSWVAVLGGFASFSLASAVASGLSDEVSDEGGGKRTVATSFGNRVARAVVEIATLGGVIGWALAASIPGTDLPFWVVLPASAVGLFHLHRMRLCSDEAVTNAFRAQRRYKQELHRAIWRGASVLAALLSVYTWLRA